MLTLQVVRDAWGGDLVSEKRVCEGIPRPYRLKSLRFDLLSAGDSAIVAMLELRDGGGLVLGRYFTGAIGAFTRVQFTWDCVQAINAVNFPDATFCYHVPLPSDLVVLDNWRLFLRIFGATSAGSSGDTVPDGEIISTIVVQE